jgi:divinyl chlorophyllide a 8-vinyl-reductase
MTAAVSIALEQRKGRVVQDTARVARRRIIVFGASGTIGQAACQALLRRGHDVTCVLRHCCGFAGLAAGAEYRFADLADVQSINRDGFRGEHFDAIVSCIASRSGVAKDAWAVDYQTNRNLLASALAAGVGHFILLSSICVQRPLLAFQQAKLAFENELTASGIGYSIVRPTAYFKSLSGQVERVKKGKPFLLFGDGALTACKPISDRDVAEYLADCLEDADMHDRILPIGGPGEAITPRQQGEMLFRLVGQRPRFRHVPLGLFDAIGSGLRIGSMFSPAIARKAELARIGRYYATESMLLLDLVSERYDAAATPSVGSDTLEAHYAAMMRGEVTLERSEHSIF